MSEGSPEKIFRHAIKSKRDVDDGMLPSEMNEKDKKHFHNHMMAAHHKFMARHYRRKNYTKKYK